MACMARKRVEYLKRKHKKESDIRVDNGKMLALLSELTMEKAWEELRTEGVLVKEKT